MEGYLLVPPERSAIIGRTGWKTRYVTFQSIQQRQTTPPRPDLPRQCSASKLKNARKDLKAATAYQSNDDLSVSVAETLYLSVWKQKGDVEPISHNAVGTIRSCEIQSIQFKKSDTPVPTLILKFELDAQADKVRKRRSSRAGALQPPTSAYPNSLLFRSVTEEHFNIYDWQVTIQPRILPRSPTSNVYFGEAGEGAAPLFTGFKNPFQQGGDRPVISSPIMRPQPFHRHSHSKDNGSHMPAAASMISPSPSLRSRRSDLSSQSSYLTRPAGYSPSLPIQKDELPSPTSTLGYEEQFISGWTNAQGRSPTVASHSRAGSISLSPIIPRETILDRAFNLKAIPGSEKQVLEDSNMSSIARFEALMKEHEKRKALASRLKSASRTLSDSLIEERDSEMHSEDDEGDNDSGKYVQLGQKRRPSTFFFEEKRNFEEPNEMDAIPPRAQMALEYISGRATPNSMRPRSLSSRHHLPPRPPIPTAPVPQMPTIQGKEFGKRDRKTRPMSFSLGRSQEWNNSAVSTKDIERALQMTHLSPDVAGGGGNGHKITGSGAKRLSFNEFTRRLSSTSSLLLVQNNTASGTPSARNSAVSGQSRVSSEASMSAFHEDEAQTLLVATRLSGLNQNAINQRPGMGARRSTVATGGENFRYGGYGKGREKEVVSETEKRIPLVRGYTEYPAEEMSGRCGQQWRGTGLIEGGFL